MRFLLLSLMMLAPCAWSQSFGQAPQFSYERATLDTEMIETCIQPLIEGRERDLKNLVRDIGRACVGKAASKCLDESDVSSNGIYDNISYMNCIGMESNYWGWRLERSIEGLKVWSQERSPNSDDENAPINALNAMVETWSSYVIARCRFAAAKAFGGREGGIHRAACGMRETAEFAREMEFGLRAKCGSQHTARFDRICNEVPF